MIDTLCNHDGGITIGDTRFNVFCYADDVLLMSTTITGLQSFINTAVDYVDKHGLRFNATKTNCFNNGTNPFIIKPKLFISDVELCIKENIDYLGATLGNNCN